MVDIRVVLGTIVETLQRMVQRMVVHARFTAMNEAISRVQLSSNGVYGGTEASATVRGYWAATVAHLIQCTASTTM